MDLIQRVRELTQTIQHAGNRGLLQNAQVLEREVSKVLDERRHAEARWHQVNRDLLDVQQRMFSGTLDYAKFGILYVDDEAKSLKCFARAYGRTFRILTAANASEALKVVTREPKEEIAVLMANHRMPGENGRWLLHQVRQLQPGIIRILVSSFSCCDDLLAATAAANSGAIYSYIVEPWDPRGLEHLLKRAVENFILRKALDAAAMAFAAPNREHQPCALTA